MPRVSVCVLAALSALVGVAAAGSTAGERSLSMRIDRYIRSTAKAGEFQGAVLVARNGRVLFTRGYGDADRERGLPNTPTTQFRLVLATELFDRIAILQLRDAGKLALDDTICRFTTPCPEVWRPITIQRLLDHRSGLADVHPLARRRPLPSIAEAVAWLKRRPLVRRRRDTSPAASIVLAHVIERVSGERWFPYLRRHILRPARMTATVPDEQTTPARRAVGYRLPSHARGRDVSFTSPDPAQGLWSTVLDLSRLHVALGRGSILAASSVDELYPPNEHVVDGQHAWDVGDGFYALVGRHTPDRLLIVLLMNGRRLDYLFYEIEKRIGAIVMGTRRARPVADGPSELAYVGPNGVLTVAGADGSDPRDLTTIYAGGVFAPTWAPDGRRLAFVRCARRRCAVFVIGADGSGERRLVAGSAPTWSPDGRAIAFVDEGRIRVIALASGRSRELPIADVRPGGGLAWSPDGRSLLFFGGFHGGERNHNALRNRLYVVAAAGGRPRVVSRTPGFYLTSSAAWSPDSKLITYSRRAGVGAAIGSATAYVASADGSGARELARDAYQPPRFTPDGAQIAINIGLGCRLRLVPITGGAAQTLPFEACEPVWNPR